MVRTFANMQIGLTLRLHIHIYPLTSLYFFFSKPQRVLKLPMDTTSTKNQHPPSFLLCALGSRPQHMPSCSPPRYSVGVRPHSLHGVTCCRTCEAPCSVAMTQWCDANLHRGPFTGSIPTLSTRWCHHSPSNRQCRSGRCHVLSVTMAYICTRFERWKTK